MPILRSKQTIVLTFAELEALINKHLKDNGSEVQITLKDYKADRFMKEISYDVIELVPMVSEHATAFPIVVAFTQ